MKDVRAIHIEEPKLLFGHSQRCEYVKDGLFSFGPLEGLPGKSGMRFGVISTADGLRHFERWSASVRGHIACNTEKAHRTGWPGFPAVFDADWPIRPLAEITVDGNEISATLRRPNRHEAIYATVGIFENAIGRYLSKEEARPDFWFVVIPEEVHRLGRPEQLVSVSERTKSQLPMSSKDAHRLLRGGARSLFPEWQREAEQTLYVEGYEVNFHNQLKARMLAHHTVVQILRETTIAPHDFLDAFGKPKRRVDDPATIAWNICTTAFFKAQGRPWQLDGVRPGVWTSPIPTDTGLSNIHDRLELSR